MSDENEKGPRTLADLLGLSEKHRSKGRDRMFEALMAAMGGREPEGSEGHRTREIQNDRDALREAIDDGKASPTMQIVTLIVTAAGEKQLLIASSVIRPHTDTGIEDVLEEMSTFVTDSVLPALKPDERATVRVHTFDAEFLSQHATETIEGTALTARVRAFQEEQERQEALKKFRKCCVCDDTDCEHRLTEPPPGYVAPESTPQP